MAKPIMIQGTMSNAGKSLLCTALCRIFKNDGYRVAPFKSQNMALNSYITYDGLEMGRAQVAQAEAAGIPPSVLMNPILLKPTTDVGSQVIVKGKAIGNMAAADYFRHKRSLIPIIKECYDALSKDNDIIVIEGAGSPAEINLKQDDIVNMGMAKIADSPVLLAGDIDRGGVFAQLYGTVKLLENEERDRIKGLIINKFRGDKQILMPGLSALERMVNIPVIGVVPYINADIDDEDSLNIKRESDPLKPIRITVIRLPRVSNFTDFDAFERHELVSLTYSAKPEDIADSDMVIIPGTKNTISDLLWMRQNGVETAVMRHAARGKPVFGICGGYQMMGELIEDPYSVEGGGKIRGMCMLNMTTALDKDKIQRQATGHLPEVQGIFAKLSGLSYNGYEIHMGRSSANGILTGKENLYGSYLHGLFDSVEIVSVIVNALAASKGLDAGNIKCEDTFSYKERQYNILADAVRQSLDMDMIYGLLK